MPFTQWPYGRTRRSVRRGLSGFEARLRTAYPGIGFTARITATLLTGPPYPGTDSEIVGAVREALRSAADDISVGCDPSDLASAGEVIDRHLHRSRTIATEPPVEFRAAAVVDLLPGDRAAVNALLAAQREQAVADTLRRQAAEAVAGQLADPVHVLLRWLEKGRLDGPGICDAVGDAKKVAAVFAAFRPERDRTVDREVLEIVRDFLSSFPDDAQKLMLYTVCAGGMENAQRPQYAAAVRALLAKPGPVPAAGDA